MWKSLHVKYPLFLSDFNETWIFLTAQIPNFMKIRLVVAQLFHADGQTGGQTDMTKLTVAFRSFANAPKTSININILSVKSS
jgi:hypothetical protein